MTRQDIPMMALSVTIQDDGSCRRQIGRAHLAFPAKVALSEGDFECVLEDLSLGGARISCKRRIESGREVWLKFDRFQVFGLIAWCCDNQYGVVFEERIPKTVLLEVQGFSVDLDAYENHQGLIAARAHVLGEDRVGRSRLMRLLDVIGPISREAFSACPQCERGDPCSIHCGHKKFKRAQLVRGAFCMALAALIGGAIGIGSLLLS